MTRLVVLRVPVPRMVALDTCAASGMANNPLTKITAKRVLERFNIERSLLGVKLNNP
jgi:hypothetical protein